MILEIKPNMFDMRATRVALDKAMDKLGIWDYHVCSTSHTTSHLSIKISEEDALIFELADGGRMTWELYMPTRFSKSNH